jgi:hypothetical protein
LIGAADFRSTAAELAEIELLPEGMGTNVPEPVS